MSEVEKTRYSDEELAEFKAIILDKLEKAKADYELLRSSITHTMSNDTEDTSPTFKVLEEGAATLSKEESGRLAQRQLKFIQHLEAARAYREQNLRNMPRNGQADSEGTTEDRAARDAQHRSERGSQQIVSCGRSGAHRAGTSPDIPVRTPHKTIHPRLSYRGQPRFLFPNILHPAPG